MFEPSELLLLVEAMRSGAADDPLERRFRTSVSRAYYASYLSVRERLRVLRSEPAYDVEHERLAKWLADHADMTVRRFGQELLQMCRQRVKCDYDLASTATSSSEDLYIRSARSLISRVDAVLALVDPRKAPPRVRY